MIETFIVHKEWLDNIAGLPVEMQDKVIADFVRYGCGLNLEHSEDPVTQSMVNMLKNDPRENTKNYKGNACNNRLTGLSWCGYDFIRGDERFKRIERLLKQYAEEIS